LQNRRGNNPSIRTPQAAAIPNTPMNATPITWSEVLPLAPALEHGNHSKHKHDDRNDGEGFDQPVLTPVIRNILPVPIQPQSDAGHEVE